MSLVSAWFVVAESHATADPNLTAFIPSLSDQVSQQILAQTAVACSYALNPTVGNHSGGSGSGGFSVFAQSTCHWTPMAGDSWIHTSGGSMGGGSINYTIDANPSPTSRVGTILVQDQTYTIRQSGNGCDAVLSPMTGDHGPAAESGTFYLSAPSGCSWSASTGFGWIHTTSAGTGSGTVLYTLDAFPGPGSRTGTIRALEQTFTVNQAGETEKLAILPIPDQKLVPGTASSIIPFQLTGPFDLAKISFVPSSSNEEVIPIDNILVGGAGADRLIILVPAPGKIGMSRITMQVRDATGALASTSFTVTVGDPPPQFRLGVLQPDSNSGLSLSLSGTPGRAILIQWSPDLRNWKDLTALQNPTGELDYIDHDATVGGPRFYRLRWF